MVFWFKKFYVFGVLDKLIASLNKDFKLVGFNFNYILKSIIKIYLVIDFCFIYLLLYTKVGVTLAYTSSALMVCGGIKNNIGFY
jgi:hypothetical protein